MLSFIRQVQNKIYNIFDPEGLKLLTRLPVGLSHLNAHIFRHNFQDCPNSVCSCSLEIEDATHYLLYCGHFSTQRANLMNRVKSVFQNFEFLSENNKKDLLLFGDSRFDEDKNKVILEATLTFIKNKKDVLDLYLNNTSCMFLPNLHHSFLYIYLGFMDF